MANFEEYIRQGEPQKRDKSYAWQTAIGLQAVDGLKPSEYLLETARRHIEGDVTIEEVKQLIDKYYASKDDRTKRESETEEADKVSANITELLDERTLMFSVEGLIAVHRRIFSGVFKHAGQIRDYNITKQEWVLNGETVLYVPATDIRRTIEYDLEKERLYDYSNVDMDGFIKHISKFVSDLWQIHPFGEGNTRTVAVFVIMYLRSLGFDVANDLFANKSWYFRNALVRANYQNVQKGVTADIKYLELFFRNLLLGETNVLKNRYLMVNMPEEFQSVEQIAEQPPEQVTEQPVEKPNKFTEQVRERVQLLVRAIADKQLSLKMLMEEVGIHHRPTFLENYVNPAIIAGFVKVLYPEKPNHPRQKYLLTVRGRILYNALNVE